MHRNWRDLHKSRASENRAAPVFLKGGPAPRAPSAPAVRRARAAVAVLLDADATVAWDRENDRILRDRRASKAVARADASARDSWTGTL